MTVSGKGRSVAASGDVRIAFARLRRRWLAVAGAWAATVIVGRLVLEPLWPAAGRWAFLATGVLAYLLAVLWSALGDNRRAGERELLATLGPGTIVSLGRGLATGLLAGFLAAPWPAGGLGWMPMALYTVVALSDLLDGYLARRHGQATVLGARLDQEIDALSMLVAVLVAISYDQLPPGFLLVGLARYLFVFGEWRRKLHGQPVQPLPPSRSRRLFAGFMMGFLSASLWPVVPPAAAALAGAVFAVPFLLGFLRDWLVVSGRLDPSSTDNRTAMERLDAGASRRLPVLWRAGLLAGVWWVVLARDDLVFPPPGWTTVLGRWGLSDPIFAAAVLAVVCVIAVSMIVMGVAGRAAAFGLLWGLLVDVNVHGLEPGNGVILVCALGVLLFGSGAGSMWTPEERVLRGNEPAT